MKALFWNYFVKGLVNSKFVLGFVSGIGFTILMAYTFVILIGDNPVLMGQVMRWVLSLMAQ